MTDFLVRGYFGTRLFWYNSMIWHFINLRKQDGWFSMRFEGSGFGHCSRFLATVQNVDDFEWTGSADWMIFVLLMDCEGSGFGNYSGCITRAQDVILRFKTAEWMIFVMIDGSGFRNYSRFISHGNLTVWHNFLDFCRAFLRLFLVM